MAKEEQPINITCSECGDTYLGWLWQAKEEKRLCLDCFACKDHERVNGDANN